MSGIDQANEQIVDETLSSLPRILTRKEVAKLLRCTPGHVSTLIDAGELDALQRRRQRGSRVFIPLSSVREYLGGKMLMSAHFHATHGYSDRLTGSESVPLKRKAPVNPPRTRRRLGTPNPVPNVAPSARDVNTNTKEADGPEPPTDPGPGQSLYCFPDSNGYVACPQCRPAEATTKEADGG